MSELVAEKRRKGWIGTPAINILLSLVVVVALAILANRLSVWGNRPFGRAVLEYPLWAVGVGLLGNFILRALGVWDQASRAFRSELFLKTGLVLMGATINISEIASVGSKGIIQAVVVITLVFFFTWYISKILGLDQKFRAVISTSVSICGVSAAIAAAGAVVAKREHLAYAITLVILFALPLMVLQPYLAKLMGLSPDVAGAWIGGNIDTTAAVVGAGAVHSEQAMKVASIVKMSQNALIGVAAFLLALYWVVVVERKPEQKPSAVEIWRRFPKFVLGFVAASVIVSLGLLATPQIKDITNLRNWFLTLAFVSIGLGFSFNEIKQLGGRPILAYFFATFFNTLLALGVAWLLFKG